MSKPAKLPSISHRTKILSFDLETNGLHGQPFAIGALVMDVRGQIINQFSARCPLIGEVDHWVESNVLPAISDMPEDYENYAQMREAFWNWYIRAEEQSDYTVLSNGYPVEYGFLLDCQRADLDQRYWQHPFPILDLTSLLLQAGDTKTVKAAVTNKYDSNDFVPHNPMHDARATALCAFEAFRLSGRIS